MDGAGELEHDADHEEDQPAFDDELASIASAAQVLATADLTPIAPQQLGDLLRRVEAVRALVDAAASAVLARFDAESACSYDGLRSTSGWLTQRCQMTSRSASQRVRTARALRHLPEVADGFRTGRFSADQVDLFARARNSRTAEAMAEDEATLAALADRLRPDDFGRELRGWAEMVDTDGAEPERGHRERNFSFVQTLDDTWTGRLDLASADGAFLHAAVEAMAEALYRDQEAGAAVRGDADRRADDDAGPDTSVGADPADGVGTDGAHRDGTGPSRDTDEGATDGVRRAPGQRRADALLELVRRGIDPAAFLGVGSRAGTAEPAAGAGDAAASGDGCAPGHGSEPGLGSAPAGPSSRRGRGGRIQVALHLLLDAGDLEAGRGADTLDGHHLSPSATDRLLCDAAITAMLRDPFGGAVLNMGRRRRVVSPAQWAALAIRDGGCSFPGCTAPPQDCEAHHIVHWRHGGPTDIDNLTLACWATHHKAVHEGGWQAVATARGRPRWFRPDGTEVDPAPGWHAGRQDLPPPNSIRTAEGGNRRARTEQLDEERLEMIRLARERAHALRHAA